MLGAVVGSPCILRQRSFPEYVPQLSIRPAIDFAASKLQTCSMPIRIEGLVQQHHPLVVLFLREPIPLSLTSHHSQSGPLL